MSTETPPTTARHRGLAVAALVLGIATAVLLAVGWIWASLTPGMAALGIAIMALYAVAIVGIVSLVVGIIATISAKPKGLAITGLVLTLLVAVVLASFFVPWGAL